MAIPMFPTSTIGAVSTKPLVFVARIPSKSVRIYGTKWCRPGVAGHRSPMDASQGQCPWDLGTKKHSKSHRPHPHFLIPIYQGAHRMGTRFRRTLYRWRCASSVDLVSRGGLAYVFQQSAALGESCLGKAENRMGVGRHAFSADGESSESSIFSRRLTRRPSPSQRNICQQQRPMAGTLGKSIWAHILRVGALSLCVFGSAQAQPSDVIQAASERYQFLHPRASLEQIDSVLAVMATWLTEPYYFNRWPRDRLEDIPFLSPKSSFELGRYIAELGYLIDPGEWEAISLDPLERRCFRAMFSVGFPPSKIKAMHQVQRWGFQHSNQGWQPYIMGHGIRWSQWTRVSLAHFVWDGQQANGPWLRARESQRIWAWSPAQGGYLLHRMGSRYMIGGGVVRNIPLLGGQWTNVHGYIRGQYFGRHSYAFHAKWTLGNGMRWELGARNPHPELNQLWLPYPCASGILFSLPWKRGRLEIAHKEQGAWLRYADQLSAWGLEQWNGLWRIDGSFKLYAKLTLRIYTSLEPSVPEAITLEWSNTFNDSSCRLHFGWMGLGEPFAFGTSPMRMSQAGPYVNARWAWEPVNLGRKRYPMVAVSQPRLELGVQLRPEQCHVRLRYSFQSDQK